MTEQSKETKPTNTKNQTKEALERAVDIVNAAIREEEEKYAQIASTDEQDPVMLEGITSVDYACHLMVDPKPIAKIFLQYNYPTIKILGQDAPQAMWNDIAEMVGIKEICGVDM